MPFYWTGNVSSVWGATTGSGAGLATNWATTINGTPDAQAQPSASNDVFFTAIGAQNLTNSLGANYTINSLNFTPNAQAVTIGGANVLTVNGGGLNVASGSAAQTVNTLTTLGNFETWTNASTNPLTIGGQLFTNGNTLTTAGAGAIALNGGIVGTGGLSTTGSGTLTVASFNNYTGVTNVASTVSLVGNLFGSSVVVNGGALNESSSGSIGGAGATFTLNNGGSATLLGANGYTAPRPSMRARSKPAISSPSEMEAP